jgi:Na+/proline symporter
MTLQNISSFLLVASPGLVIGGLAGGLIWRRHRVAGAIIGAIAGAGLWLYGWLSFGPVTP